MGEHQRAELIRLSKIVGDLVTLHHRLLSEAEAGPMPPQWSQGQAMQDAQTIMYAMIEMERAISEARQENDADRVAIWSGEHQAYWRKNENGNCSGYTVSTSHAGVWLRSKAVELISGCGPEKRIILHVRRLATSSSADLTESEG